jgi:group II intron reverse transcriptase/maturase
MTYQMELPFESVGETPVNERSEEALKATHGGERPGIRDVLKEALERRNLHEALKRVKSNGGSAGVDGMTVEELSPYLRINWPRIREDLLAGRYRPAPVLQREIPKSSGGVRELGIPTVLDRFIQQALLQVLQPQIDPSFSEHSFGFRPGRSAHQAVKAAQRLVAEGRLWVVDVDLEKFFDRVNHDILMERLSRRIADRMALRLIRRYLEAGVLADGVWSDKEEGTPQGGPLSPFLANVLLDEVDRQLEKWGHHFVRYADDCNVYVKSKQAGERVMARLSRAYANLKLRINEAKSAVDLARRRDFLGFSFYFDKQKRPKRRVSTEATKRLRARVRKLTYRTRGRSLQTTIDELRVYLLGWKAYFGLAETTSPQLKLDGWIRHRLRALQLKHWRRGKVAYRALMARGTEKKLALRVAKLLRSWWRTSEWSAEAIPNRIFDEMGLPRLAG